MEYHHHYLTQWLNALFTYNVGNRRYIVLIIDKMVITIININTIIIKHYYYS